MNDMTWVAVVPVKDPKRAKSRLGPELEAWRTDLAAAFAADTLSALLAATRVEVIVVVGGQGLPATLLEHQRVRTLPDPGDLNAAAGDGIAWARRHDPTSGIVVLAADLPSATRHSVDALLTAVPDHPLRVLADIEGVGSTGLLLAPGATITPAFGGASLARHQAAGAAAVTLSGIDGLRRDVDTADQLLEAVEIGVGPHTRAVLSDMGVSATKPPAACRPLP